MTQKKRTPPKTNEEIRSFFDKLKVTIAEMPNKSQEEKDFWSLLCEVCCRDLIRRGIPQSCGTNDSIRK